MTIYEDKTFIYNNPKKINIVFVVKAVIYFMQRVFYNVLFFFCRPQKRNCRYQVSICAIFKDEADYFKEWIEYHRIVGVDHFYLYNNLSTDDFMSVLKPYIEEGIVTLNDWLVPHGQMGAYQDCIDRFSTETEWIGFLDLDEFVVPNKTDTIGDFLKSFKNRPVVIIYWKFFGTSGYMKRDTRSSVVKDFVVAWPKYFDIGKYFFNTSYTYDQKIKGNLLMHSTYAKYKGIVLPPVNVFKKVCTFGMNPVSSMEMPIQINHYVTKSYAEYIDRKAKRGGGVNPVGVHDLDYFYYHEHKCCDVDYHAYKYLVRLELAMNDRR